MNLDQIQAFLAVVRRGSISRAALELYRTQPAISLKIQSLEAELGHRLLERRRRGVSLTPAGEIVRRRAESILGELDTLRKNWGTCRPAGWAGFHSAPATPSASTCCLRFCASLFKSIPASS